MSKLIWYPGHSLLLKDIVRAENCNIYDSEGKKYVDLESGVWCTPIGHGHPKILRAISEQASQIMHAGFNYAGAMMDEVAEEVLSLLGFGDGKCVFLCSGSEAVEYGVRVAQRISERPLLMTMTDSYFGAYGSASRKQENEWFVFDWMSCTECVYSHECSDRCSFWTGIPFKDIGGFLFEPGSSSGLVRFPPEKLIRNIVARVRENNGLILVNEVTTGVGRTGLWFGFQHYGISPDIAAMGKGIGNGYPVSVTAFTSGVIERLGNEPLKYAQSHQNDPLGATIVREVIRIINEEGLIEKSRERADLLYSGLKEIKSKKDCIENIRARGLMLAVDLKDGPEKSFTVRTHQELVQRGYILGRRPGTNVLRLDPSLTISSEDIHGFLEVFEDVL